MHIYPGTSDLLRPRSWDWALSPQNVYPGITLLVLSEFDFLFISSKKLLLTLSPQLNLVSTAPSVGPIKTYATLQCLLTVCVRQETVSSLIAIPSLFAQCFFMTLRSFPISISVWATKR